MTNVRDLFSVEDFNKAVDDGFLSVKMHPTDDLDIFCYTPKASYTNDAFNNPAVRHSRGLIVDHSGSILARPWSKFFNCNQDGADKIDLDEPVVVMDKADGCFPAKAVLNLWGGGTVHIGDVVKNKLDVTLVGMDAAGNIVPTKITKWFDNGMKTQWSRIGLSTNPSRKTAARGGNRLYVTPNHHVYRDGEYIPVSALSVGDELVSYEYTFENLDLFLGGLLGDGAVCHNGSMCNYQESHTTPQRDYVLDQRALFSDGLVSVNNTFGEKFGGIRESLWLQTKTARIFSDLRSEWYPNGIKVVPKDLSFINDAVVAKWYMDDGSRRHSDVQNDRILFHTNGFSEEDVTRLANKLYDLYGVSCKVHYSKGWQIRVNYGNGSINTLWSAMAPYIFPSMEYKLPEEYRGRFIEFPKPALKEIPKKSIVTSVEHDVHWYGTNYGKSATRAYDIETETHNYMCQGVLVHNSLGVLYFNGDGYSLATKSSFMSEQARHGTSVWNAKYEGKVEPLPGYTFLFEIVYRENKIVIDYGDMDDLVLLGAVEIDTGLYFASDEASTMLGWTGQIAKVFPYKTLREALEAPPRENAEGFVILAADHKRMVKYKYEDYLYLHRMVSNLTPRSVWERLYNKESVSDIVGSYPDEFQDEVTEYIDKIKVEFSDYIFQVALVYDSMKHIESQKDFAQEALKYPYSAELFLLRQNRDIFQTVMKRIYPPAIDKS